LVKFKCNVCTTFAWKANMVNTAFTRYLCNVANVNRKYTFETNLLLQFLWSEVKYLLPQKMDLHGGKYERNTMFAVLWEYLHISQILCLEHICKQSKDGKYRVYSMFTWIANMKQMPCLPYFGHNLHAIQMTSLHHIYKQSKDGKYRVYSMFTWIANMKQMPRLLHFGHICT